METVVKMDLKHMEEEELEALKNEIKTELKSRENFNNTLKKLRNFEQEAAKIQILRDKFEEESDYILSLKKLGFSIVVYSQGDYGFVNFSKKRINGKYYGIDYRDGKFTTDNKNMITDQELKEIQKIIFKKEKQ